MLTLKSYRHVYAVGDLQGCFAAVQALMQQINFDPQQDFVLFAGDLVARGEDSLATLRWVKALCEQGAAATVLGNHDLNLIACAFGIKKAKDKDRTQALLDAVDATDLIAWLCQQPLLIDIESQWVLTHAGIPHIWSLAEAQQLAQEVEQVLKGGGDRLQQFLQQMYGAEPEIWADDLQGNARLRVITNYLTRMRLVDQIGRLEFSFKESLQDPMPTGYAPWFSYPHRIDGQRRILFGHWAALQGQSLGSQKIALDGGCVWGGQLLAYELMAGQHTAVFNPMAHV
jgi:bis(5'-nucleosyl)-tetraphosphatase (symmetrical)